MTHLSHISHDALGEICAGIYLGVQLLILFGLSIHALFAIPARKYNSMKASCSVFMVKLWFEMTWKMRFVYMTYMIHVCDTVTDLWVLVEWYYNDKASTDSLNAKSLTYVSIVILLTYKVISCLAVYFLSNLSAFRVFLHFFDLLLFEEMFISDESIVKTVKYKRFKKSQSNNNSMLFQVHLIVQAMRKPNFLPFFDFLFH